MVDPDAARVVASVKNAELWPDAVSNKPRDSVRELLAIRAVGFGSKPKSTVSATIKAGCPDPARAKRRVGRRHWARPVDLSPKPHLNRLEALGARRAGARAKPRATHISYKCRAAALANMVYLAATHGNSSFLWVMSPGVTASRGRLFISTGAQ
jgi:hypothetical protein